MIAFFKRNPTLKNIFLMMGFGLLSLIMGEIKITVPGMDSASTDLREIAVFTSIFYLPHWIYLIGITIITSLAIPEGGNYNVNIIMHIGAVLTGYFAYHTFIKRIIEPLKVILLWSVTVAGIYYLILLPLLVISSAAFGIIKFSSTVEVYNAIISVIHFEIIATLSVSSLVLVSRNMRKLLLKKNQELKIAKKRAEQSDQLKTEFLTQMSHEIRTPLNSIMSFSGLLKDSITSGNNSEQNTIFDSIANSCNRIIRTIELILNISQMKTKSYDAKFVTLNLFNDLIRHALNESKASAVLKNIKLDCIYEKEIEVKVDEYSARLIFEQLLDNAIKYTEQGSVIIEIIDSGGSVLVTIADTGIGISDEYLTRIFEPFSQEEQGYTRAYDGNGLGLSLVKICCDLNKIKIDVKSEKGRGTTFKLEFPQVNKSQSIINMEKIELLEPEF